MQYEKDRVTGLRVAYIGGGSRGWAWKFMTDIAMDPGIAGEVRLYDIDRDAAEKNKRIGDIISACPEAVSRWRYTVADSLQAALTGADFVVISILPATFDEMGSDVHAPEAVGVYQSVGDTVGPGGFMRAMRTIPMFMEFGAAIRDYAPDAWVINYTNPMSLCVGTLYRAFPQVKAFGCCHEVFGTQRLLAAMLKDMRGIEDVPRQKIEVNVQGINHFTWFTSATYEGEDLFPIYREFADRYAATGFIKNQPENWRANPFACTQRVKFDLFRKYGKIAAAGDRHLAEFLPPWYLKDQATAESWGFVLTPVSWRKWDMQNRLAQRERLLSGEEQPAFKPSGEEGHLMLKALLGLGDMVTNVNIPNRGQIPNLPEGAIVETNALFRRDSIRAVYAGPMDGNIQALVARHVLNQRNALDAAVACDRGLALSTFMNEPLMAAVRWDDGEKLFDRMIRAQIDWLPEGWKKIYR